MNPYTEALKELRQKPSATINLEKELYSTQWFYTTPSEKPAQDSSVSQLDKQADEPIENPSVLDETNETPLMDMIALKENITRLLGHSNLQQRFENKEKVRVFFVSDYLRASETDFENDFSTLFDDDIALLFGRMVSAMKLETKNYFLSAVKVQGTEESYYDLLLQELYHFSPEIIITLGVTPTHSLLKSKERLKDIHGEFFNFTVNDKSFATMPLFSPHLLGSAPNMKRIAWGDMQKVMERLSLR